MPDNTKQPDRVVALANRLRLLQIDFADQGEDIRREYLAEEVRRVLGTVPPNERKAFLAELQNHFPTWDSKVDVQPQPGAARPAFDDKELKDPSFLVTRLIEACKSLPESQRNAVSDRLMEAGLVGVGTFDWPDATLSDAKTKLQVDAKNDIVPARSLELAAQLAELVYSLDQVAWKTWRAMAPNSTHRRAAALNNTISRFVSGDTAIGRDQLVNEVKLLRQLIAALIGTLSQTGKIAVQHFRSISPDEIQVLVGTKGFGREAAYWRKYVELAGSMESASTEDAIRTAMATFAEALIQGAR